jgi:hypothetical protein
MARADRLDRLDNRRAELEADYAKALIEALRVTAAGQWGLFGHNADRISRNAATPFVDNLLETGKTIDQMREHQEYLASRGPVKPDAVGEPKQAQAWLDRLGEARQA